MVKPYDPRPALTSEQRAAIEKMEAEFEAYNEAHPDWEDITLGPRPYSKTVLDEFADRLERANYLVEKGNEHVRVKKP